MFKSIIYTSNAARDFSVADLTDVLAVSRRNNARWYLSGVLLFESGTFLQVLEGPAWPMARAIDRIAADKRHSGLQILANLETDQRFFPEWAMGSREMDGQGAFMLSPEEMAKRMKPNAPPVVKILIDTFFRVNAPDLHQRAA